MKIFKVARIRKVIDRTFEISVLLKAFFGFFEILGGILFSISDRFIMNNFIISMAQQEIAEDQNDLIANFLIKSANNLANGTQVFAVVYLIFHGVINIFLAVFLLKNKTWAYPWSMALFSLFIIYQVYRYFHTYSFELLFLMLFDVFIVFIIWLEYKRKKKAI
ncbi:MAG: DUF2127 domain-containing protein [Patescibacteria group bacterium]